MTVPTATFTSATAIGNREDLANWIDRITPMETPFYSMIQKNKATSTLHEWQTDALRAGASNAQAEGDDTTATTATPTIRLTNRTQILKEAASVSGTQEAVDKAGRSSEMAYQVSKKSAELKLDIEYALTRNSVTASSPRQLRGLIGWANTANVNGATTGTSYVPPNYVTNVAQTDGTQRAFTETLLKDVLQKVYTSGGRPTVAMMGAAQKQTFSTFTGNATRTGEAETGKLNASIDVYVSDFGTIKAVINLQQRSRDVHIIDPTKWAFSVLRPWEVTDLAKTGDADRKQILVEASLECRNPLAFGLVADVL